jgi:hypothetical protein
MSDFFGCDAVIFSRLLAMSAVCRGSFSLAVENHPYLNERRRQRDHGIQLLLPNHVPCNFDVSSFFEIIKPDTSRKFDHHWLIWAE